MKNIEWIKSLNVNEMAEILVSDNHCGSCAYFFEKGDCNGKCEEGTVKWLEQEHEEKLKPCPFCGSDDAEAVISILGYKVVCRECGTMTRVLNTKDSAIEHWNTRY